MHDYSDINAHFHVFDKCDAGYLTFNLENSRPNSITIQLLLYNFVQLCIVQLLSTKLIHSFIHTLSMTLHYNETENTNVNDLTLHRRVNIITT